MLQQTRVETVVPYYTRFLARWPTVEHLARARRSQVLTAWAGLGYYQRARNLHACARTIARQYAGMFPTSERELRRLPGIGAYSAAAIAAIAFDLPTVPIDGNIRRVLARVYALSTPTPHALATFATRLVPRKRAGDFAQALMDLGAMICTPKNPDCDRCPWRSACAAHRLGLPETFPKPRRKNPGPLRQGIAFCVQRADGALLVRTRPERGLLGGMTEVPTSRWAVCLDARHALDAAPTFAGVIPRWRKLPNRVNHAFTHFSLELSVYVSEVPARTLAPPGMRFALPPALAREALPKLMQKVIANAVAEVAPRSAARGAELDLSTSTPASGQ